MTAGPLVFGWDVGGAHVKACLLQQGRVLDVAQWACPLWQGLQHLDAALAQAAQRWPALAQALAQAQAHHAVTMTGEMVDLFATREDGVRQIAAHLDVALPGPVHFYAGASAWRSAAEVGVWRSAAEVGVWRSADEVGACWAQVASANWRATASHVATWADGRAGVLVDVGSTTTDLVAFGQGRVLGNSHSDAHRLASGELVYHGVVRTPLCALAPRIALQGCSYNVMNEFFATTADVYRLTGELDPAHDLHPAADGAPRDTAHTQRRLARMVGHDAGDASADDWLALARAWRSAQVAHIASQLQRVHVAHRLPADAEVVAAGCGAFLVADVWAAAGLPRRPVRDYGTEVARLAATATPETAAWARVCAPSVAVATLLAREQG